MKECFLQSVRSLMPCLLGMLSMWCILSASCYNNSDLWVFAPMYCLFLAFMGLVLFEPLND